MKKQSSKVSFGEVEDEDGDKKPIKESIDEEEDEGEKKEQEETKIAEEASPASQSLDK